MPINTVDNKPKSEVLDVNTCQPPAQVESLVTRDSLLKPPDWRYQAASQYLSDKRNGQVPTMPSDPVVQYLIRGMCGMNNSTLSLKNASNNKKADRLFRPTMERYMQKCWPVLFEVLVYGVLRRRSAIASMLDTCLIKGWSHEEARIAGCPVSREVYELYAKAFFDLTGIRAVHCWIQDFLFEPERYSENTTLLRARMLAYFGGGMDGTSSAVSGMLSETESTTMRRLMTNERQKNLFDYVVKKTEIDPEVYSAMMETALKDMAARDFQEHMKDREDAGSGSLEELAEHMEEGIRAFSQSELLGMEDAGIDFVNQYTKVLARDSKNGKENIQG